MQRIGVFTSMVVVGLLLTGCSSSPGATVNPPVAATTPAKAASSSPSPSATQPSPSGGYITKLQFADKQGYKFDLDINFQIQQVALSTTNDEPGKMSAQLAVSATMSVANRTPGHNLVFAERDNGNDGDQSYPRIYLMAIFAADSAVCTQGAKGIAPLGETPGIACSLFYAFGKLPAAVSDGATAPLETYNGAPGGLGLAGVTAFSEASGPEVKAELSKPLDYAVLYLAGDDERFTDVCPSPANGGPAFIGHQSPTCTPFNYLTKKQPTASN